MNFVSSRLELIFKTPSRLVSSRLVSRDLVSLPTSCSNSTYCMPGVCTKLAPKPTKRLFARWIGKCITSAPITLLICMWYVLYASVCIYGLTNMPQGLTKENIVPSDFYIHKYFELSKAYMDHQGAQAHIAVINPPDFRTKSERERFVEFLKEIESGSHIMGAEATDIWIRSYLDYLAGIGMKEKIEIDAKEIWGDRLHFWLTAGNGKGAFGSDVHWDDKRNVVGVFRFRVGLQNFSTAADHTATAYNLRDVCARYSEYDAVSYHYFWPFADQLHTIKPLTLKNVGIAMCAMTIVAVMLISSFSSIIVIIFAMLSNVTGVAGLLSIWGIKLDVISMTTTIMSIGMRKFRSFCSNKDMHSD